MCVRTVTLGSGVCGGGGGGRGGGGGCLKVGKGLAEPVHLGQCFERVKVYECMLHSN